MSSIYPDLTTNFPESVDSLKIFRDIDIATKPLVDEYYALINSGRFMEANSLISNNTALKETILTADLIQLIYDQAIAAQRFYLSDFQQYIMNAIQFKGVWSQIAQYQMLNIVNYEGHPYIGVRPNIPVGILPTNTDYWIPQTVKGDKGDPGLGLKPKGIWNNITQYNVDDLIVYNGTFWFALRDNINSTPNGSSLDWAIAPVIIPFVGSDTDTTKTTVYTNGNIAVDIKKEAIFDMDNPKMYVGCTKWNRKISSTISVEEIRIGIKNESGQLIAKRTVEKLGNNNAKAIYEFYDQETYELVTSYTENYEFIDDNLSMNYIEGGM